MQDICIHANSPVVSGSLPDMDQIWQSPFGGTKSTGYKWLWVFLSFKDFAPLCRLKLYLQIIIETI